MDVFAIDPGPQFSAWVRLSADNGYPQAFNAEEKNEHLLDLLCPAKCTIVCEWISNMGMNAGQDLFETCYWIGRFAERSLCWPFHRITRHAVKLHLCGSPRAKDPNVRQAIIDRFGGDKHAIGGVKCPTCKGKGRKGRDRAPCPACLARSCVGSLMGWQYPPGPLHKIGTHAWSALAVGLTHLDQTRRGDAA